MLVPSDPTLTLEWDRPANVSAQIQITYIVDINSTDPDSDMNFRNMTSETRLSVHFLEELLSPARGRCVMFEFSVSGVINITGVGDTATLMDTVPICESCIAIYKLQCLVLYIRKFSLDKNFTKPRYPCV